MKKKARKKIFYILLLVFLVLSPALLAYSLGYSFDFSDRIVKKNGGIFIKSITPRVSIFLSNNFVKETSLLSGGAFLTEIPGGTHLLRIEKAGFHPWSKKILVEPAVVTELRSILLIPDPLFIATTTAKEIASILSLSNTENSYSLDKNNTLFLKRSSGREKVAINVYAYTTLGDDALFVDRNGFLSRYSAGEKKIFVVERPGFFLSDKPIRFTHSPSGEVALIDPADGFFFFDPAEESIRAVKGEVKKVEFDSRGRKMLLLKDRSIEIIWLGENSYQPFEKRWSEEDLITLPTPILDAKWFYGSDMHVVYRTKDGLFLIELDGRGGRNVYELLQDPVDELITSANFPNDIYFRRNKVWQKIEL